MQKAIRTRTHAGRDEFARTCAELVGVASSKAFHASEEEAEEQAKEGEPRRAPPTERPLSTGMTAAQ